MAGDPATIWRLVAGGSTDLPSGQQRPNFVETVWNAYYVENDTGQLEITASPGYAFDAGYLVNSTGSGGVDTTQPIPSTRRPSGSIPSADPNIFRAVAHPDVSTRCRRQSGTLSCRRPQMVRDGCERRYQRGARRCGRHWRSNHTPSSPTRSCRNLGYANDLHHTAADCAGVVQRRSPWATTLVVLFEPGQYPPAAPTSSPTRYGYAAGWGYDLTSGLGSPNGVTAGAHPDGDRPFRSCH